MPARFFNLFILLTGFSYCVMIGFNDGLNSKNSHFLNIAILGFFLWINISYKKMFIQIL